MNEELPQLHHVAFWIETVAVSQAPELPLSLARIHLTAEPGHHGPQVFDARNIECEFDWRFFPPAWRDRDPERRGNRIGDDHERQRPCVGTAYRAAQFAPLQQPVRPSSRIARRRSVFQLLPGAVWSPVECAASCL